MAPRIESGVQRRMENPTEGSEVTLLIKLKESSDTIISDVEATGITVEEEIPLDYIVVTAEETQLADLCHKEAVTKVEIEGEGSVMGSDFRSPTGSAP